MFVSFIEDCVLFLYLKPTYHVIIRFYAIDDIIWARRPETMSSLYHSLMMIIITASMVDYWFSVYYGVCVRVFDKLDATSFLIHRLSQSNQHVMQRRFSFSLYFCFQIIYSIKCQYFKSHMMWHIAQFQSFAHLSFFSKNNCIQFF